MEIIKKKKIKKKIEVQWWDWVEITKRSHSHFYPTWIEGRLSGGSKVLDTHGVTRLHCVIFRLAGKSHSRLFCI